MDDFDRQILVILQNNSRITTEELGGRIGLSATACQRRLKNLRHSGVIEKEIAIINGVSLGGYVTVIVNLEMKQGGVKTMDDFKRKMRLHPQVQQCYYTTGDVDFICIIIAETMQQFEQVTRKLFYSNQQILKYKSTVVMENIKVGLQIPLAAQR